MSGQTVTIVKEYTYWNIELCDNQSFLGRCTIRCKRMEAEDVTHATPEEWAELHQIYLEMGKAVATAFEANYFNTAFLGNSVRQLHAHFVPRYETPRTIGGVEFTDRLFGREYVDDPEFVISSAVHDQVADALRQALVA